VANELRLRQNFLGGLIEDNPLSSGATTLTSSSLTAMVVVGSTTHLPLVLDPDGVFGEPETVYVTAHTTSATTATILRGQEGTTARAHNRDTPWVHGPTARDFLPAPKTASRSASDLTFNSATWANVDTALDLTITAAAGDVIGASLYARIDTSSNNNYFVGDFHTLVAGSFINSVVTGGSPGTTPATSSPAWGRGNMPSLTQHHYIAGEHTYTLQSGDISAGTVTLRLRAVSGAAITIAASDPKLIVGLRNYGPGA
jgi:hypothetical protein